MKLKAYMGVCENSLDSLNSILQTPNPLSPHQSFTLRLKDSDVSFSTEFLVMPRESNFRTVLPSPTGFSYGLHKVKIYI
jgi:hypothetical protein